MCLSSNVSQLMFIFSALSYWWYKDGVVSSLQPVIDPDILFSLNGRLYISTATADRSGNYHCIVFAGSLPVQKESMPISLQVIEGSKKHLVFGQRDYDTYFTISAVPIIPIWYKLTPEYSHFLLTIEHFLL